MAQRIAPSIMKSTKGVAQNDTQDGTQGGTQEEILDKWIENQIRENPQITTEELAQMRKKGLRTIKRHIARIAALSIM